ncbi:MAG: CCA tRNA nucleotidyltransferase [Terriglobales bacterium]
MSASLALDILHALRAAGHQAYFAGGSVRDQLLGRPAADYDVATDALPEHVQRLFPRHAAVGAQFGVILVHGEAGPEAGHSVEVATFRADLSYADGRRPAAVRYTGDWREDVRRRDFTVNGLLLDPDTGEVLDAVGGQADLSARVIRAIGDPRARFREDRLRLLRAPRFAARLDFTLDAGTAEAIRAEADALTIVSPERTRDELLKMLTEGGARRAFELLDDLRLLPVVLPEVAAMKGVAQPPQFHPEGDVWTHTLMMLAALPAGADPVLALGVLLHDVGKPPTFRRATDRIRFDQHAAVGAAMAEQIGRRLRLPGEQIEQLVALVAEHMKFGDVERMRLSTLKRFLRQPGFARHLELHRLDCLMSHGDLRLYEFARQQLAAAAPEQMRPPRLLTGDDLAALGYPPGPAFREMLAALEDAQLEGRLVTRAEAVTFLQQRFPR